MQKHGHGVRQLPEQQGLVHGHRSGRQDPDDLVADFPAVAVRTVQHVVAPALPQAGHIRQFGDCARCHQEPARANDPATVQGHGESLAAPLNRVDPSVNDIAAVPLYLRPSGLYQVERIDAVARQKPMDRGSRCIERLSRIDHQYRTPRPRQHQGPTQSGRSTADHDHVICISHLVSHCDHLHDDHLFPCYPLAISIAEMAN